MEHTEISTESTDNLVELLIAIQVRNMHPLCPKKGEVVERIGSYIGLVIEQNVKMDLYPCKGSLDGLEEPCITCAIYKNSTYRMLCD